MIGNIQEEIQFFFDQIKQIEATLFDKDKNINKVQFEKLQMLLGPEYLMNAFLCMQNDQIIQYQEQNTNNFYYLISFLEVFYNLFAETSKGKLYTISNNKCSCKNFTSECIQKRLQFLCEHVIEIRLLELSNPQQIQREKLASLEYKSSQLWLSQN